MELMNKEELAGYLKTSLSSIKYLLYSKLIPRIKVGKEFKFVKEDIDNWIRAQKELPKQINFRKL